MIKYSPIEMDNFPKSKQTTFEYKLDPAKGLILYFGGSWTVHDQLPDYSLISNILEEARQKRVQRYLIDASGVTNWDSVFVTFLIKVFEQRRNGVEIDTVGVPDGVKRLVGLATAVAEVKQKSSDSGQGMLALIGEKASKAAQSILDVLEFVGELAIAFWALIKGKARFRGKDLSTFLNDCGPSALPIVSLISGLVGLILAFVGAVQLKLFGAEIYVADLVGIGMAREMGAMMTGIIMAGRTGAAFAAQLGTMQVNEEIDALKTFGFSPVEYLVLPRVLALGIMMPLLCIYADIVGMLGGLFVSTGMLDIPVVQYYNQTVEALNLNHFLLGIIKSFVFGLVIAIAGCMKGIKCGKSAYDVGLAATSAVVVSIVMIVVLDGLFAVICDLLGI